MGLEGERGELGSQEDRDLEKGMGLEGEPGELGSQEDGDLEGMHKAEAEEEEEDKPTEMKQKTMKGNSIVGEESGQFLVIMMMVGQRRKTSRTTQSRVILRQIQCHMYEFQLFSSFI